jgi:glycine dehydrogenase subunit 1
MGFVPNTKSERDEMLREIGISSFDDLLAAIPEHLKLTRGLDLPAPVSEWEVYRYLSGLASKNVSSEEFDVYLGGGIYDHYVPAVVDFITSRPEFATAYTPYQAEVSQGTLQSIYEFQSMIARLTAMDVANASMYDGASATAEAVLLSVGYTKKRKVLLSSGLNPFYRQVVSTYVSGMDVELVDVPDASGLLDRGALSDVLDDSVGCVVIQSPNFYGLIEDLDGLKQMLGKSLLICVTNPISLGILKPPGVFDVDICVGEAQCLGNPISYGGPGLGIFATKKELVRKIPGRLVGRTTDVDGKIGYVLTLQTREQHIRRDKATSNICTNQALCALASTVYLSLLGRAGIVEIGETCVRSAHYLADRIASIDGYSMPYTGSFFNEFVIRTPIPARELTDRLEADRILAGIPLEWFCPERKNDLLIAVTEKRTRSDLDRFVDALSGVVATRKVAVD